MSIEPVSPELKLLIDAEPLEQLPVEVEARLFARLDASIELSGPTPTSPPALSGWAKGAGLFLAGVVSGALGYSQLAPTRLAEVAASPPAVQQVVTAPAPAKAEPQLAPLPEVAPAPAPEPRPVVRPKAPPVLQETSLDRERQLLEAARTAVARSMVPAALASLEQHAFEFPQGVLAEERDALWVQALAVSGDLPAARARAGRFTESYPDSLFLPVVERAVRDVGP